MTRDEAVAEMRRRLASSCCGCNGSNSVTDACWDCLCKAVPDLARPCQHLLGLQQAQRKILRAVEVITGHFEREAVHLVKELASQGMGPCASDAVSSSGEPWVLEQTITAPAPLRDGLRLVVPDFEDGDEVRVYRRKRQTFSGGAV